jgi:hypothetical protein
MTEQNELPGDPPKRYVKRRLTETILTAFHHACDLHDIEAAWELLNVLDFVAMRTERHQRRNDSRLRRSVVAAHERLWLLRHPEADEQ